MPQARLPDINTAFIVYRREVLSSLNSQRYQDCFGALNTLNGLLPEKYRVIISTEQFNEKTKQGIFALCTGCNKEIDYSTVEPFEVICTFLESAITRQKTKMVWMCPECKSENQVNHERMIKTKLQEPYFLRVVPNPPERKDGLIDRTNYHGLVSKWVWMAIGELEAQMAQFRDDNWHKEGELFDIESDVDTTGEDE